MNLVHVKVSPGERGAVTETLSEKEVNYVSLGGDDDEAYSVVAFALPTDAVEHVLADLQEAGLDDEAFTIVSEATYSIGTGIDNLLEEYEQTPNRLGWRAIRSKVRDMRHNTRTYLLLMFLSTVIATAGLLAGSPAIIVGSMVIAPIVSPALASSLGMATRDRKLFLDGVRAQAVGLAVAIVGAIAFATAVKTLYFVPQTLGVMNLDYVSLRLGPSVLAVTVGLAAGSAAAYGLATKQTVSITGVMIAAALVPSAGATGIAVAWARPLIAVGSAILLLVNLICINLAGAATLWFIGYRRGATGPEWEFTEPSGWQLVTTIVTVLLTIAVVVSVGYVTFEQLQYQQKVNQATSDVLERPEYRDLAVVSQQVPFVSPLGDTGDITVVLSRTSGQEYPRVADRLDRRISETVDRNVTVKVRFVDYRTSSANRQTALRSPATVSASPAGLSGDRAR